eukprot:TRINITY_DN3333_c0_g1_i1.p1 TRINITY_DN3333_c0_g1~~TRINITY_DN3333_c0_g1_i1.p1  ORF type:complete len:250 (-),score=39.58 TRINITY_DN3333_c0_g1_i1:114-863(-)
MESPTPSPFADLRLASHAPLYAEEGRKKCTKCDTNRKFFCYYCQSLVGDEIFKSQIPKVKLPLQVNIVHHPQEHQSKSTAMHAKVLAPDDVNIYEFPEFPDYSKESEGVALLFPSPNAKFVDEVDVTQFKKLVVVDSTWQQTHRIITDPKLANVTCLKIRSHKTRFWRYQKHGEDFLATVEAIYYFVQEYHTKLTGSYEGQYDNLLYFFAYQYDLIQRTYKNSDKNFWRIENYVKKPRTEEKEKDAEVK